MFGGHWPSASEDIRYLICHLTSQDLVLEELCDFKGGSSSLNVTTLPNVVALGIVDGKYFLICHMILQDHVIEGSCDFMGRSP